MMDDNVPSDKGWAWVCMLGASTVMCFLVGGFKTMGILFVQFQREFHSTAGLTAWMFALTTFSMSLTAPIAGVFSMRYTCRVSVMIGGALASLGCFLAAFAPNIYFVIFVYGILTGTGYGFMFGPSFNIITIYFKKRRSLANGLTLAGASIGQLVLPQLLTYLLFEYGLRGTLYIYSAFCLHFVLAGLLMRPASYYERRGALNASKAAKQQDCIDNCVVEESVDISISEARQQPADSKAEKTESDQNSASVVLRRNVTSNETNQTTEPVVDSTVTTKDKSGSNQHRLIQWIKSVYDWKLFTNLLFITYTVGITCGNCGYVNPFQLIPPHAKDLGLDQTDAALLLSVIGISDLVGRVFGGWFADLGFVRPNNIMSSCIVFTGLTLCVYTFFEGYTGLFFFCVVLGLIGGFYMSLMAVVCVEFVGEDRFPQAFGLCIFFMNLTNTFVPVILGLLRDYSGAYTPAWWVCGLMMVVGGLAFASEPVVRRVQQRIDNRERTPKPDDGNKSTTCVDDSRDNFPEQTDAAKCLPLVSEEKTSNVQV